MNQIFARAHELVRSIYFAPAVLFIAAVVTLLIAIFTNRGDMTSAVLVVLGFMMLVTGILLLTGVERKPHPAFLTETMSVQETINYAAALADLGVTSNVLHRYLPENDMVIAINPVTGGIIPEISAQEKTFVSVDSWSGVSRPAAASSLLARLKAVDRLRIPTAYGDEENHSPEQIEVCLNEVFADYLAVASRVTLFSSETSAVVTMSGFAMGDMCRAVQDVSAKCCTMSGCAVCSLAACILAEGLGADVMSDSSVFEDGTLTMVFSVYQGRSVKVSAEEDESGIEERVTGKDSFKKKISLRNLKQVLRFKK